MVGGLQANTYVTSSCFVHVFSVMNCRALKGQVSALIELNKLWLGARFLMTSRGLLCSFLVASRRSLEQKSQNQANAFSADVSIVVVACAERSEVHFEVLS